MSELDKSTVEALGTIAAKGDDEHFHIVFDATLEAKLDELDVEWMKAMRDLYRESKMGRWCA